jgi:hypothetical protein
MKKLSILLLVSFAFVLAAFAQSRQSVSGAEVTGTFRFYTTKNSWNEVGVLALGKGKLKVKIDLTYARHPGTGDVITDGTEGIAEIVGDTAVLALEDVILPEDKGKCKVTIKFVKPGQIKITRDSSCRFGMDIPTDGIYRKVSKARPGFEEP